MLGSKLAMSWSTVASSRATSSAGSSGAVRTVGGLQSRFDQLGALGATGKPTEVMTFDLARSNRLEVARLPRPLARPKFRLGDRIRAIVGRQQLRRLSNRQPGGLDSSADLGPVLNLLSRRARQNFASRAGLLE